MMIKLLGISIAMMLSANAMALESGYYPVGRVQHWVKKSVPNSPQLNVFLKLPATMGICPNGVSPNSHIFTIVSEDADSTFGKNAWAMILAAKAANKKLNFTYECTSGGTWGRILGVDIE